MRVRPLRPDDYPAIQALHRHVGWAGRSPEGWRWLDGNPARHAVGAPAGWVVDGPDGRPAAHIGNLVQPFQLGAETLYGATGFSLIVTRAARGASRALIRTFSEQAEIFATYLFNANASSQPIYGRHGFRAWPEATHQLKLSWIVDPVPLAAGRVLRLTHRWAPELTLPMREPLLNDRLFRAPALRLPAGVSVLTDLRDASPFGEFWLALSAEPRVLGDRSPARLRWRLADPDLTTSPVLLAFTRGHDITAYASAMLAKSNVFEAPVLEIIDLEALADEPDGVSTLMTGLMDVAKALGAAKVRLQTVAPLGLQRLGPWARSARREGGWGHCHSAFAPDAPDPQLWSPTPYDGDYAMCLRQIPRQRERVHVVSGSGVRAAKA